MSTSTQPSLSLLEAVGQVRDRHIAAANSGDVEAAVSLFGETGVFLPPGQSALQGAAAIRSWFTYVFANFVLHDFALQPGAVEQHGDIAIEHGDWTAAFQPKDGSPGQPGGGTYLTVYARVSDGTVRVIRDAFNGMPGR